MDQPPEKFNPFAPPQARVDSPVTTVRRRGRLASYEKAGRVIRLMGWLTLFGVVAMTAVFLIIFVAFGTNLPLVVFAVPAVGLAFVFGLLFLGNAVKRHEDWARTVGILYAALLLLGFPLGTVIGLYLLWQLGLHWDDEESDDAN